AFVSSLMALYGYWQASRENEESKQWQKFANTLFYTHTFLVFGVVIALFTIIFNHYFEYHYAWSNSSLSLPLGYAISCFWQDQEGSFLLWIFWNALVGISMIWHFRLSKKNLGLSNPALFIVTGIQAFLLSM